MVYTTTLTQKGQITIPIDLRKLFGLKPYEKVILEQKKDGVLIKPQPDITSLRGSLKSQLPKPPANTNIDKAVTDYVSQNYEKKEARSR